MATRQYIGARYVPKFYDFDGSPEWRSGVAYESLTIVTRNGNSYTSKIPVPSNIGAPENNPNYWVSTGLYNAQVEAYRQLAEQTAIRVEEVATDTAQDIADEASAREQAISAEATAREQAISAEATARANADNAINTDISTIKNNKYIKQTKMLAFGDSFGNDGNEWSTKLSAMMGLTLHNYCLAGAAYPFTSELNQATADFDTSEKKSEISFAIVYGGINNMGSTYMSDASLILSFISGFKNAFPNVRLYVAPFNICSPIYTGLPNAYRNTQLSVERALPELIRSNIDFTLMKESWMFNLGSNGFFSSDNLHPTESGSIHIAKCMRDYITGRYDPNIYIRNAAVPPTGVTFYNDLVFTPDGIYTPDILIATSSYNNTIANDIGYQSGGFYVQRATYLLEGYFADGNLYSVSKIEKCGFIYCETGNMVINIRIDMRHITNLTDYSWVRIPRQFVPYGFKPEVT